MWYYLRFQDELLIFGFHLLCRFPPIYKASLYPYVALALSLALSVHLIS